MDDQRIEEIAARHSRVSAVRPDMVAAIREALSCQQDARVLEEWHESTPPTVTRFNHAVQTANGNYLRVKCLEEELRSLREELRSMLRERRATETASCQGYEAAVARAESAEAELQRLKDGMRGLDVYQVEELEGELVRVADINALLASLIEEKVT